MDIDRVFSVRKDMYLQHIQTFPEPIPNFPVSQYYQYLSSMFWKTHAFPNKLEPISA
jgi:hypothetical protein